MDATRRRLDRLRRLARLLDGAVRLPLVGRVGLDALLGLLPVVGDVAGAVASAAIVVEAARMGAPRALVLRMLGNLAIDLAAGVVPVSGDHADVRRRTNERNVALLEAWIEGT